jgi:hypothetical protein
MEDQLNKYFEEYENLLKTKDYKLLSDQEKSLVNLIASEEEYGRMRKIFLLNKEIVETERKTIKPSPVILGKSINVLKSKQALKKRKSLLYYIFGYNLPAYQVAIYTTILAFILFFAFKKEKFVTIEKPVYIYKTDTIEKYVFKENITPVKKNNIKHYPKQNNQIAFKNQVKPKDTVIFKKNNYTENTNNLKYFYNELIEMIEFNKPQGRTMQDDSAFVKILGKI